MIELIAQPRATIQPHLRQVLYLEDRPDELVADLGVRKIDRLEVLAGGSIAELPGVGADGVNRIHEGHYLLLTVLDQPQSELL